MSNQKRLAEIADIRQGRYLAPTQMFDSASKEAPIPVWGANGILGYTEKPTYTYRVPLVTCRGNGCGLVQWPDDKSYISNNAMGLEPKTKTKSDSSYLYYSLLACDFSDVITGSAQPQITVSHLSSKMVTWVDDENVRGVVADVLSGFDRKIDLNRRINQILEAMAQAIFQSWFVDFEPVKAKIAAMAEGRDPLCAAMSAISGKPEAELDTLPPEQYDQLAATAALFPDEMAASDLGEIPKGWFVRTMPDCIDVNPSRTLKKGSVAHYLDMANVPTNSARVQNIVSREFTSGSKFKNGDTLLARITPCLENGKTAFVDFLNGDEVGWGSTEFIVLRPKNGLPEPFAYFLCRYPDFRAFAISQMAGTSGRQRVPNDCFGGYKLVEPPAQVAVEFGRHAGVALSQMKALDEEARALASLRETLLPKLLSGELPVAAIAPTLEATP